jgi:branched-chain amino acid transport system substrate-binding protein
MSQYLPGMTDHGFGRRTLFKGIGLGALAAGSAGLLSACGGLKGSGGGSAGTLKIGLVSPQTGALASFAGSDNFVVQTVTDALKNGVTSGGKKYSVEIVVKDTQSDPNRATDVTKQLINDDKVDIVVGSGTPDTTNPVADQCEASGIPNVTTIAPWEAWFFGRGKKEGEAFKYSTLFFFGMKEFGEVFFPMWNRMELSNKNVSCLWPDDTDANAFRGGLGPLMTAAGYTPIDGGKYKDGATDYSAQIAKFKDSGAELFTCTPIPPDFQAYWKQAAQQDYRPKLATVAKVMLFPSEAEALGDLTNNIATDFWWAPTFPYKSSLDGTTAQQLADNFAEKTGKQWTQALGSVYSLFEIAVEAFKNADDPKDHDAVAAYLQKMSYEGVSGPLNFGTGPVAGVAIQKPVGGQWRPGKKFAWEPVIVDNTPNKDIPLGGDLEPTFSS